MMFEPASSNNNKGSNSSKPTIITSNKPIHLPSEETTSSSGAAGGGGSYHHHAHDDDEEHDDPLATTAEVLSFIPNTKVKIYIVIGLICATISGVIFPAMAFLFSSSFEDLSASTADGERFLKSIRELAYSFMILGVVAFTFMTLQTVFLELAATAMANNLTSLWFQALLRQDMAYYDLRDISGTATIVSTNGHKFKRGVGAKLGNGVQFFFTIILGLIYGFWSSWQVSLLVLTVTPFMAISAMFMVKMVTTQTSRANSSYAKAGSVVYTAVSSIRTVLSLNAVEGMIAKYEEGTQQAYEGATQQVMWLGFVHGCLMASFLLAYIPVTLYGAWLLYENVKETGCDPSGSSLTNPTTCEPVSGVDVLGAMFGVTFAGSVLPQISASIEAFTLARSAAYPALVAIYRTSTTANNDNNDNDDDSDDQLKQAELEAKSQALQRRGSAAPLPKYCIDSSSPSGLKPNSITGNIRFDNVYFSYPSRMVLDVFNGFSLNVPAGKTVALVGTSGGGKSTAVHLLERFYDPKSGSITIDGIDLRQLNIKWLREQIGLVSQEPTLFALSIRDNIAIGYPEATQQQIEEAARKANAHDFIVSFPDGYDTQVGDQGAQLSGGQKQRIAIARVLIKSPKILLFDEATSALDSEAEAVVQEALDILMEEGRQTIIVIAHRLSTIKNADTIALISAGKVLETGSHDELMQKKASYYDLVEAQRGVTTTTDGFTSKSSSNTLSRTNSLVDAEPVEGQKEEEYDQHHEKSSTKKQKEQTPGEAEKKEHEHNHHKKHRHHSQKQHPDPPGTGASESTYFMEAACQEETRLLDAPAAKGEQPVLRFRDVHFHYPSRPMNKVLRGLNLVIKEGETLAIVGPSGKGKSTIIQLIESFYRPTKGSIEFRGVDVKELNIRWFRDQLSLVSQEPILFDSSIGENIRFGCRGATQEDTEWAATKSNANDFIMSFPDGYNTEVGSGTSLQVSGGQKQRIAIARALLRKPKVLLLDEATSALDSESEKVVQEALDSITVDKLQTTIVIAHRLSTVRNADRIAVVDHGVVQELGTHVELMANLTGKYRLLQSLQDLDSKFGSPERAKEEAELSTSNFSIPPCVNEDREKPIEDDGDTDLDQCDDKKNAKRARLLAKGDGYYFFVGSIGAVLSGIMFPAWGFVFAFMIEVLYFRIDECDDNLDPPISELPEFDGTCQEYWNDAAIFMHDTSFRIFYGLLGIMAASMIGNVLLRYGFGIATERMNKRVRNSAFKSLIRQEVGFFDVRPLGAITTQLSDDATLIQSFSGQPIRMLVMNLSSVAVGLVVSFIYMWPFALLTILIIPFMSLGKALEIKTFMSDDAEAGGSSENLPADSAGGIVVESLLNIRTVASLAIEGKRIADFQQALKKKDPNARRSTAIKGSAGGVSQIVQMWCIALMFWWGGWLLYKYPTLYSFRDMLISLFGLFFGMTGIGIAMQGLTDSEKAREAAFRIFELIDRKSEIDPLSDEGKKLD